mmetsp:Transcript_86377/g.241595  ORF Transcript_86377/g.241595 Transcript_86377/m.241595 type:complete len:516 (-) Transcript_86377:128-1675(-)
MARGAASSAQQNPLVLLTDLSGTLIHRSFQQPVEDVHANLKIKAWHIYERPYAEEMLRELSEHPRVKLGVFTTMTDHNAKLILNQLGWSKYFFYIYAQNESLGWCEVDHENWNPEKERYEWKKNLCNVFQHASRVLGFAVDEQNCVLVDDTPRKTRDYWDNVVVPGRYDEAAVRGPNMHLVTLLGYLMQMADRCGNDVKHYMGEHPFADFPVRQPTRPTLAPKLGAGGRMIPRGGSLKGAAVQTLFDSNFKLLYDEVVADDVDLSLDMIHQHLRAWLEMRQVINVTDILEQIASPSDAVRLWSSEARMERQGGSEKFYKFTNGEVRRDDHNTMPHVAFLVRLFNAVLAQPFQPRMRRARRGSQLPHRKIEEFFERVVSEESDYCFRVPCFWALSLSDRVAEDFAGGGSEQSGKKGYGKSKSGKGGGGAAKGQVALQPVLFDVRLPEMLEHAKLLEHEETLFPEEEEVLFPPYSLFKFCTLTKAGPAACWRVEIEAMPDNRAGGQYLERAPCLFWS